MWIMSPVPFLSPDGLQLSWDVNQSLLIPVWAQTIVQFSTLLPINENALIFSADRPDIHTDNVEKVR